MVYQSKVVKNILLLSAIFIALFVITIYLFFRQFDNVLQPVVTKKVLNFSNGKKIYVRARCWGITGQHEEIVFSEVPIKIPNKKNDYIFYTDEVLYKIENNVLTIYAPESGKNIPDKKANDIKIIFKGLKTADVIQDYGLNYKTYKLQKINCNPDQ